MGVVIKGSDTKTYAQHLSAKPVVGKTSIEKKGETVEVEETLTKPILIPTDKLLQVFVSGGMTMNQGNYESAKITVGITVPTTKDDLESAYDWASDWMSEKLAEAAKIIKGEA